mgnify:CR=1 FL=1
MNCWRLASVVSHLRLFSPPARPGCSLALVRPIRAPALRVTAWVAAAVVFLRSFALPPLVRAAMATVDPKGP